MDARTFDQLTAEATRRPTRRAALRLLAGSLLGGLLSRHKAAFTRAAQIDVVGPPSTDLLCTAQGLSDCGGVCADISADPANCGACGAICGAGQSCFSGVCLAPAPSSDLNCAAQGLTNCGGVCTNTLSDNSNCGACGNSCPLGGYCQGGVCAGLICLDGLTDCYGRCVDLSSDWSHCGGCEYGCFAGATCVNGQCVD